MTLREAAQRALTAIDRALPHAPHCGEFDALADMADDLRAALAEPTCKEGLQVEPVAWRYKGEPWFDGNRWHDKFEVTTDERVAKFKDKDATPLYTTPAQRKPLAEEEIADAANSVKWSRQYHVDYARAIERAHGIGGDA